jgi:hypothetical protein
MKMNQVLLFIAILAIAELNSCPNQYNFPTCTLDLNYYDSSCFNFNFVGCYYFGYMTTIIDYDWQTCTNLCCDPNIQYLQNSDSIALCENFNNWSNIGDIIIIIMVMIAFVIPSLIVMTWTLFNCCRRCR